MWNSFVRKKKRYIDLSKEALEFSWMLRNSFVRKKKMYIDLSKEALEFSWMLMTILFL